MPTMLEAAAAVPTTTKAPALRNSRLFMMVFSVSKKGSLTPRTNLLHDRGNDIGTIHQIRVSRHRGAQADGGSALYDGCGERLVSDRFLPFAIVKVLGRRNQRCRGHPRSVPVLTVTNRAPIRQQSLGLILRLGGQH